LLPAPAHAQHAYILPGRLNGTQNFFPSSISNAQNVKQQSNVGLTFGNDVRDYKTSTSFQNEQCGTFVYQKQPYENKNLSRVTMGKYVPPGGVKAHYTSEAKGRITNTVHSTGYEKSKPFPGFDRQTSNKTNYSLGKQKSNFQSAAMDFHKHPTRQPVVNQPTYKNVGNDLGMRTFEGGRRANGLEHIDRADYGVQYNIVNGASDFDQRDRVRKGERYSNNRLENDRWRGDSNSLNPHSSKTYNIVEGRQRTQVGKATLF
jgi:hypothetical protein